MTDKPQEPQLPSVQARKAARELSCNVDSRNPIMHRLDRDLNSAEIEAVAAIIDRHTRADLATPQPVRESLEKILQCFANGSTPDASVIQEAKDALTRVAAPVAAAQEKDRIAQLTERINSFRRLEPNWDSYGARTICPDAIDEALRLVPMFAGPKWFVAPRSDGDIQFEADHVEVHIEGFSDPLPISPVTAEGKQK